MAPPSHAIPADNWFRPVSNLSRCRPLPLIALLLLLAVMISSMTVLSKDPSARNTHTQLKRQFQLGGFLGRHVDESLGRDPSRPEISALSIFVASADANRQADELLGGLTGTASTLQIGSQVSSSSGFHSEKSQRLLEDLTNELRNVVKPYLTRGTKAGSNLNICLASLMSPLWDDLSPLLSHLSQMVMRVSGVDTGATARLLDSILGALPIDNADILDTITQVASQTSVDASDMLLFVIPALSSAMGKPIKQRDSFSVPNLSNALENIVSQGCIVISLLVAVEECITDIEMQKVLDQIASISCLAAQRLKLFLCMISREIRGVHFQIQVPCLVENLQSSSGQPQQNANDGQPASKLAWAVTTLTSAGVYMFSSSSSAPSQSEQTTQVPHYDTSPTDVNGHPATLPSQYSKGQLTSTSTLPGNPSLPEYSVSQPPGQSANSLPSLTDCPCQTQAQVDQAASSETTSTSYTSPMPCPGRGYPCEDCPGGWFCAPQETPAQSVACGLGWPCYHCSSGLYCISASQSTFQPGPSSGTLIGESPKTSIPQSAPAISSSATSAPSPEPTIGEVPGNWRYLGCFQDSLDRVLQDSSTGDTTMGDMTNSICVQHCQNKGYAYAGTENRSECWCGKALKGGSTKLPDAACTMSCQSSETECCGGAWTTSVYSCQPH